MSSRSPIFNNVPPEAAGLVEAARSQTPRLEFASRNGEETSEITKDGLKDYARSVVAATESNQYKMPTSVFLNLWEKA